MLFHLSNIMPINLIPSNFLKEHFLWHLLWFHLLFLSYKDKKCILPLLLQVLKCRLLNCISYLLIVQKPCQTKQEKSETLQFPIFLLHRHPTMKPCKNPIDGFEPSFTLSEQHHLQCLIGILLHHLLCGVCALLSYG